MAADMAADVASGVAVDVVHHLQILTLPLSYTCVTQKHDASQYPDDAKVMQIYNMNSTHCLSTCAVTAHDEDEGHVNSSDLADTQSLIIMAT